MKKNITSSIFHQNQRIYILFGLPGAGKGVCAQAMKEVGDFMHLSMGEYLRKQVRNKTKIGLLYKDSINGGLQLVPCKTVCHIFRNKLIFSIKRDLCARQPFNNNIKKQRP